MKVSAVYARTPVADQQALAWQVGFCTAYCKSRGWMPVFAYSDDGYAGTTLAGRPQLSRLFQAAEAGLIERLVVDDMFRLTESPLQLVWILAEFRDRGIAVYAVESSGPRWIQ